MSRDQDIQTVRDILNQQVCYNSHRDTGLEALDRLTVTPSSDEVQKAIDDFNSLFLIDEESGFYYVDSNMCDTVCERHKKTILSALRSYVPVDVEALKKKMPRNGYGQNNIGYAEALGWNDCLDHLKSKGLI